MKRQEIIRKVCLLLSLATWETEEVALTAANLSKVIQKIHGYKALGAGDSV